MLSQEARRLYLFTKGGDNTITQNKRETLFIQMLEGLSAEEAKFLITVVNKRVNNNAQTDPQAIREGRVSVDKTEYKGKGSSIRIKRAPTKRLKTGIAMYMPGTVQVSYKTDYQDTPMGAVTEQALNAYNAAVGLNYRDFATNIGNMDQGAIELLQQAGLGIVGSIPGMAGVKEAFEMKQGVIISDRLELAFKGVGKRNFTYDFKMIPKNQDEADMIRKIIFAFKANMLPEFAGGNRAGRRLIVPNTFDIQYMYVGKTNEYLHNISTCVLQDMTVQYGGSRYKTFDANSEGAPPVETSISLNFQEMELITRERVFEGF